MIHNVKFQNQNSEATSTTDPKNQQASFEQKEERGQQDSSALTINILQCSKKAEDFASEMHTIYFSKMHSISHFHMLFNQIKITLYLKKRLCQ